MRRPLLAAALLAAACGGGDDEPGVPDAGDPNLEVCAVPEGAGVNFDPAAEPCRKLSSHRFFTDAAAQTPNTDVVPYDLNTALFSDYSTKYRFIWLPAGASMTYADDDAFTFPVGAVIIKTFGYLDDLRLSPDDPAQGQRLLETRLLIHRASGWEGLVYLWDEDQSEARLTYGGRILPISWIHTDGQMRETQYIVPNTNKCAACHEQGDVLGPIGPRARHLNRDLDYGAGPVNQLTHFTDVGYLTGAPANPMTAPRNPPFDDTSEPIEVRARDYLEINCAHCHSPMGHAGYSGLDLRVAQLDPTSFGICKPPVAAGSGAGDLQYDIVPGDPDQSIMVFRIASVEPDIKMPEVLHGMVHDEGVAVVREWITSLTGGCPAP